MLLFKTLFAIIGVFIGWFLGNGSGFVYVLMVFIMVSYITEIMVAILNKSLQIKSVIRTCITKILIFLIVGISHILDTYLFDSGDTIRNATIFFYVAYEGINILKNAQVLGLPVPKKLEKILIQLNDDDKKEGIDGK